MIRYSSFKINLTLKIYFSLERKIGFAATDIGIYHGQIIAIHLVRQCGKFSRRVVIIRKTLQFWIGEVYHQIFLSYPQRSCTKQCLIFFISERSQFFHKRSNESLEYFFGICSLERLAFLYFLLY